jgi:hypothetical protein
LSAAFYVLDAVGQKFLFTIADADYEPAFRKHAKWWRSYMRCPRHDCLGRRITAPCYPCKVVVEVLPEEPPAPRQRQRAGR